MLFTEGNAPQDIRKLLVVKTVQYHSAPDLDETLLLIETTGIGRTDKQDYCFMQAGAALKDKRAVVASFDRSQEASDALASVVARWGPQSVAPCVGDGTAVQIEYKWIDCEEYDEGRCVQEDAQYVFDVVHGNIEDD